MYIIVHIPSRIKLRFDSFFWKKLDFPSIILYQLGWCIQWCIKGVYNFLNNYYQTGAKLMHLDCSMITSPSNTMSFHVIAFTQHHKTKENSPFRMENWIWLWTIILCMPNINNSNTECILNFLPVEKHQINVYTNFI